MTTEHRYFAHDADVGVIGRGKTPEEAFVAAAEAVFSVMVDPTKIRPTTSVQVEFEEEEQELALVTWLNALLAEARTHRLALARFELTRSNGRWIGRAWGEPWRDEFDRGLEVKGATLTMLSVRQAGDDWEARCVVDV